MEITHDTITELINLDALLEEASKVSSTCLLLADVFLTRFRHGRNTFLLRNRKRR